MKDLEGDVDLDSCVFIGQSNDGVEVQKRVTYTPITGKILNFSAKTRGLLQSILLLGYMPPKVKNKQNMILPVVEMFEKRCPRTGRPLKVFDAYRQTTRKIYFVCAQIVNDLRGMPDCSCGASPPALVGSCLTCRIRGITYKGHKGTFIPGAVRTLPSGECA